jgi:PAS domain S-box-containing protein
MRVPVGSRRLHAGLLVAAALILPAFLWPESWTRMLTTEGFLPHSYCYVWQPGVIWLNAGSDAVIGVSYLAISATLALLVHKARREIPYSWMIQAFGLFIVTCGLTHLMEVWTLWAPRYWLAGELKLVTALASAATAIALPTLVPKVLRLASEARLSTERKRQLEAANEELTKLEPTAGTRAALQKELRSHDEDVSRLTYELIASKQALQRSLEELRALGARFGGILDIAEDAVISVDAQHRITLFNRAAERTFGYSASEVMGLPLDLLLPDRFAAFHRQHIEGFAGSPVATRRMGELREVVGRRKDGSEFPAEASISKLGLASGPIFTAFLRDVTERKRSEAAREESERRWRAVYENSAIGIALTDVTGRILAANPALQRMLGYTEEELRRLSVMELTPEEDREATRSRITELTAGGLHEYHLERRYLHRDGSIVWANTSVADIPGNERMPRMFVRIIEDVSEQKRTAVALATTRAELARMTRVTTMGELAASIAHEVNQPLAAVVANGNACRRWLAARPPNMREADTALRCILEDASRASDVISRIRGFLKRGESRKAPLEVNDVIREVISLVQGEARTRGVSLRVESAADLPPVAADRVQLQQVILNLVMNAIEAMARVTDRARVLEVRSERHRSDTVLVAVRDSGVGLDPEHRVRIFDAFYTTKPEGMGMGLAISRSIVEAHGGRLWAIPNDGPGTTFQFTLPVGTAAAS